MVRKKLSGEIEKIVRDFGNNVVFARSISGMTATELGKKCGYSPQRMHSIEKGIIVPHLLEIYKISKVLGVSPSKLIDTDPEEIRKYIKSKYCD